MKVRYLLQPEWGVGHLVRMHEGGTLAEVVFPGRGQPTLVSTRGNSLVAHPFVPGDRVRTTKGRPATRTEPRTSFPNPKCTRPFPTPIWSPRCRRVGSPTLVPSSSAARR